MPSRRTRTDEILEELVNNPEPERSLRGYEIIRMVCAGRIPPDEYRYETELMDGRKQIETFEADENGRVKNLKTWIENPVSAESKPKKQGRGTPKSRSAPRHFVLQCPSGRATANRTVSSPQRRFIWSTATITFRNRSWELSNVRSVSWSAGVRPFRITPAFRS